MSGRVRLSALESYFLHAERPGWPMHVGSLALFEREPLCDRRGRVRVRALRELVRRRLPLVPRLSQRVEWPPLGLGRPEWVDVPAVHLDHHVRLVHLAPPGDREALRRLVATLHTEPLDRSRPLWEVWVIDGIDTGEVAVVEKVHHAVADGIGGVDVALLMLDLQPASTPAARLTPGPAAPASALRVAVDDIGHTVGEVGHVVGGLADAARHPSRVAAAAGGAFDVARSLAGQRLAPSSSLNRTTGRGRAFETVDLPLAGARLVGERLGGTVNDVVLTAVGGGLRGLLLGRGEGPKPVRVLVPVSVRGDDERGTAGNLVSGMIVLLPLGVANPAVALRLIAAATRARKQAGDATAFRRLLRAAELVPERGIDAIASLVHRQPFVNLVVTNVPGPQFPLYLLGARMIEVHPVVPLTRNIDVSVAVLSYDGTLGIGLFADRDTMPDLAMLREGIAATFDDLQESAKHRRAG